MSIITAAIKLFPLSLTHQIEMTPDEAIAYSYAMDNHPEGYGVPMPELIQDINDIIPLAKGEYAHQKFRVGREGSPVLYLDIAKLYIEPYQKWDELIQEMQKLANKHECDEFELIENTETSLVCRFWWD